LTEILRITGAFGVRGALRAWPFSVNLCNYDRIFDKHGNCFTFRVTKFLGGSRVVIAIDGVHDRDAAESLKGEVFYVKKSDLPPVGENEFYLCDLIGKDVFVADSDIQCRVTGAENFGAGDLIELSHENATFLVPFTRENFPDTNDGRLQITPEAFYGFKN
jgi:16S rRNA processing protein RimM